MTAKKNWNILRTILFIVIGFMNTIFIKPEDIGSWKNYAGYLFLLLALIDTIVLIKNFVKDKR